MAILEDVLKKNPERNSVVRQNFGAIEQHVAMAALGSEESITKTAIAVGQKLYANKLDRETGLVAEDREAHKAKYGEDFPYIEGELPTAKGLRYEYHIKQMVRERQAAGINGLTGFAAGSIGNMAMPLDIALMALPTTTLGKVAQASVVGVKTGKGSRNVHQVVKNVTSLQHSMKIVDRVKKPGGLSTFAKSFQTLENVDDIPDLKFATTFTTLTKAGFAEQALENSAVYFGSQFAGRDYGMLDVAADTLMGGAFHSAAGSWATLRLQKLSRTHKETLRDKQLIRMSMSQGNYGKALELLQTYDATITEAINADPTVARVMGMSRDEMLLAENKQVLRDFLNNNQDTVWFNSLKGLIHQKGLDDSVSVAEAKLKQHMETQLIVDAIKDDKVEFLPVDIQETVAAVEAETSIPVAQATARAQQRAEEQPPTGSGDKVEQASLKLEEDLNADAEAVEQNNKAIQEQRSAKVSDKAAEADASFKDPIAFSKKIISQKIKGPLQDFYNDLLSTPEDLADTFAKAAEGLKGYGEDYNKLLKRGLRTKKFHLMAREEAFKSFHNKTADISPDTLGEEASRMVLRLKNEIDQGDKDAAQAEVEFDKWSMNQELAEHVRDLIQFHAVRRLDFMQSKAPKTKLKGLKTFIDGLSRKDVDLKFGSIAADRNAQIAQDQYDFHRVCIEEGLLDIFEGANKELDHLPESIQQAYDLEKRLEVSNAFVRDLMYRSQTGKTPDHWKGEGQASFDKVWQSWDSTTKSQLAQLNELGAGARLLQGHSGISSRFDNQSLQNMGFAEFRKKMLTYYDWEETKLRNGGVMPAAKNDFGHATDWKEWNTDEFIEAMYAEATDPNNIEQHWSADIAKSFGKSRSLVVRIEHEADALLAFSGHASLGRLYLDQVRHKSEQIAVAKNLGNKPLENFAEMLERLGISEKVNKTRTKDGTWLDRLALKSGFGQKLHELDFKHMMASVKTLTGVLDNPANHDISYWAKTVRSLSHILYLPTATTSAITDFPLTAHTLNEMGMDTNVAQVAGAMRNAASRMFHGDRRKMQNYLQGAGAGFDAMLNAGARFTAVQEASQGRNIINNTAEAMFSWNGLNSWTHMMQEAYTDILTQGLARMANEGEWDPHTKLTLEGFGIDTKDLEKFVEEGPDGILRLSPQSIKDNPELRRSLLQYFSHFRDQAVIVPDISTQAAVRFGLQSGTWMGEAVRTLFQYQAWPLAMNRVVGRRFLINNRGDRPINTHQVTFGNTMAFMGTMLTMAYISTALKDLARGREPMAPWDLNASTTIRVFNQSGVGGMLQSMLQAGTGEPTSLLAPLPNMALSATVGSEGVGDTIWAGRALWGYNVPIAGAAITSLLGNVFPDLIGSHVQASRAFVNREYGTDTLPGFAIDTND